MSDELLREALNFMQATRLHYSHLPARLEHESDLRARITARLSEPEDVVTVPRDEWMPIETAPKDGTHILIWVPSWINGSEARYLEDEGWWLANNDPTDHWGEQQHPTHWQPLPAPPKG